MEMVVLCQTFPDVHSPPKRPEDVALDDAPIHVAQVIKLTALEQQAKKTLENLVAYHGAKHISSINLMTCTQALVIVATSR